MKVYASITGIKAEGGGGKEPRVVWAWSDGGTPPEEAAVLETDSPVVSNYGSGVVAGQSPTFFGVNKDRPVNISGGLPIYGPRDPNGSLAICIWLLEMDKDYQLLGQKIEEGLRMSATRSAIEFIAKGAFGIVVPFIDYVPDILKAIGNPDLKCQVSHFGHSLNNYGITEEIVECPGKGLSMTLKLETYPDVLP